MMEEEQKEHVAKLNKMEREMEEVFERKVREKKQKLSDNERDLERRQNESTTRLQQLKKELEVNNKHILMFCVQLHWVSQENTLVLFSR